MLTFLQSLLTTGTPLIETRGEKSEPWMASELAHPSAPLNDLLEDLHNKEALTFPGQPPAFHSAAALWALRLFFRGSCYYLFREIEVSQIMTSLSEELPDATKPEAHLSAHLVVRHLPKLLQMTLTVADGDPLLQALTAKANTLPYSCPKFINDNTNLDPIFAHPAMAQSWIENLIAESLPLPADKRAEEMLAQLSGLYRQEVLPSRYHLPTS